MRSAGTPPPERLIESEPAALTDVLGDQIEPMRRYADILCDRGVVWGLLGPKEPERIWTRHILNCQALSPLIGAGASLIDVGSGAGLPGVVLALSRPDLEIVLLEPLLRRSDFLNLLVDELGLAGRVQVVRARSQEYRPASPADVVVCRAVAGLSRLVEATAHLFRTGQALALKGERAGLEIEAAEPVLRRYKLRAELSRPQLHPELEPAHVVRLRPA
ncbi:MAG: 16S rRNA (guanine(527)-N(7))-methyltransferase RsmG [Propionibacteriaceae bacterium]|jgi:16S rRNA (guanine527-N7)-methyltransferase|nr:16S rRNA (guanine(527)-N(7))-methyltransferase RsmG [Propionibacteriaceae bacterium]